MSEIKIQVQWLRFSLASFGSPQPLDWISRAQQLPGARQAPTGYRTCRGVYSNDVGVSAIKRSEASAICGFPKINAGNPLEVMGLGVLIRKSRPDVVGVLFWDGQMQQEQEVCFLRIMLSILRIPRWSRISAEGVAARPKEFCPGLTSSRCCQGQGLVLLTRFSTWTKEVKRENGRGRQSRDPGDAGPQQKSVKSIH
jgi:hypothetical protein